MMQHFRCLDILEMFIRNKVKSYIKLDKENQSKLIIIIIID
jgi:hypothetical protein